MVTVSLPWPATGLSPNARLHWSKVATLKGKAKVDAMYLTYEALPCGVKEARQYFAGDGPIIYQVTFYPPDKRHRDDDNMIASLKAARDGIAAALAVNDRRFRAEYRIAEPQKPGRVEIVLATIAGSKDLG